MVADCLFIIELFSNLDLCTRMHCNIKNEYGKIIGVMCGSRGSNCDTEQWCSDPRNEKKSYLSNDNEDFDCYFGGIL